MPTKSRRSGVVTVPKRDLEQQITDAVIAALENGTVPWRKPWATGSHRNLVSGKTYRGVNPILLEMASAGRGFTDPRWLTLKQLTALGGTLIGEKGDSERATTMVVFWKVVDKDRHGVPLDKPYRVLRHYNVFNVEQVVGVELPVLPHEALDFMPHVGAQAIVDHMPQRPNIAWGGNVASYEPVRDRVQMPTKASFESVAAYYRTLFHELAHSTAHETRLNRPLLPASMSVESYAKEELVAELASAMLAAHCGLPAEDGLAQTSAYCAGWLKALKNDKSLVLTASSLAQRATDFILDVRWEA